MYDHIGLGGVLTDRRFDLRRLVPLLLRGAQGTPCRAASGGVDAPIFSPPKPNLQRFWREMREGLHFLRDHRAVVLLGISWALFLGAMITGVVVTPSLSDRIFHAGAVGYGWLNAGWGTGAFVSALYAPAGIAWLGGRRAVAFSMAMLSLCALCALQSRVSLAAAISIYFVMGSARGVGGVAMNTSLMEMVPKHLMGRVQNAFYFFGNLPATRARARRRGRRAQCKPGRCLRHSGLRVWIIVRGSELAGRGCRRGRSGAPEH